MFRQCQTFLRRRKVKIFGWKWIFMFLGMRPQAKLELSSRKKTHWQIQFLSTMWLAIVECSSKWQIMSEISKMKMNGKELWLFSAVDHNTNSNQDHGRWEEILQNYFIDIRDLLSNIKMILWNLKFENGISKCWICIEGKGTWISQFGIGFGVRWRNSC